MVFSRFLKMTHMVRKIVENLQIYPKFELNTRKATWKWIEREKNTENKTQEHNYDRTQLFLNMTKRDAHYYTCIVSNGNVRRGTFFEWININGRKLWIIIRRQINVIHFCFVLSNSLNKRTVWAWIYVLFSLNFRRFLRLILYILLK